MAQYARASYGGNIYSGTQPPRAITLQDPQTTHYKQNDTVSIHDTLADDLTNATSVKFQLSETPGGGTVVNRHAVIQNQESDLVRYDWHTGETDRVGVHYVEWRVEFSDGSVETYPRNGYKPLRFHRDQK